MVLQNMQYQYTTMEMEDCIIVAVTALGFLTLSKHLLPILTWLSKVIFRRPKNLLHYGSWAVVTGTTDGIGKAIAFELASQGLNLICVGRNPSKLEISASELRQKYGHGGIEIRTVVVDFAKLSSGEIQSRLEKSMEGVDVGVVVNSAGLAYPYMRYLHEVDVELTESMVRVNVEAAMWVAKAVIPKMMEKRRGAIVNIGSGCSVYAPNSYPLFTLYIASKAFMEKFSKSISLEYEKYGIDIQCQVPLFVSTKMTMFSSNILVPSAAAYSRASVRWIGSNRICCPHWSHMVQGEATRWVPDAVKTWFLTHIAIYHRNKQTNNLTSKEGTEI